MTYDRCLNPTCRRTLTTPESRARGYGRQCWEERQPQPLGAILRALPLARRAMEIAGQLEIGLTGEPGEEDAA